MHARSLSLLLAISAVLMALVVVPSASGATGPCSSAIPAVFAVYDSPNPVNAGAFTVLSINLSSMGSSTPDALYWYVVNGGNGSIVQKHTATESVTGNYSYDWVALGGYSEWKGTVVGASGCVVSHLDAIKVTGGVSIALNSSKNPAEVNTSITFSGNASGGTTPYTFDWTGCSSSSASCSESFTTAGSHMVTVQVTDASGNTASATVTETVYPALLLSLAAIPSVADSSTIIKWTAHANGGSGTYEFGGAPGGGSISYPGAFGAVTVCGAQSSYLALSELNCSAAVGSGGPTGSVQSTACVKDSLGYSACASAYLTIHPDPSTVIVGPAYVDEGTPATWTAVAQNGTAPYTYTWSAGAGTLGNESNLTYAFSTSGQYTLSLQVHDSAEETAQANLSVTVFSDPVVTATDNLSTTGGKADVGYPVGFTATASGGVGSYTYRWVLNGVVIGNSSTLSRAFGSAGTYTLIARVTDGAGTVESADVSVTIDANPSVTATATPATVDSGSSAQIQATVSGGTGYETYSWTIGGAVVSTSPSFTHTFDALGNVSVNVTVVDQDGHSASGSVTIRVVPDPSVTISAAPDPTDVGVAVTFSGAATGGVSPYNWSWTIGSATKYGSKVVVVFNNSGPHQIALKLTDSEGVISTASTTIAVNADPAVTVLADFTTVDQGVNDTFTAQATGGTSPTNYTWSVSGVVSGWGPQYTTAFGSTGSRNVSVVVRDSLNQSARGSAAISVTARPTASIDGPTAVDIHLPASWVANGSLGTAPYNYTWEIQGSVTGYGAILTHTFAGTGSLTLTLILTDSQGGRAWANLSVVVSTDPSVVVQSNVTATDVGDSVSFTVVVSGGSGPYTYLWYIAGSYAGSESTLAVALYRAGSVVAECVVEDTAGARAYSNDTIQVNPLPTVSFALKTPNVDPNASVSLTALAANGTAPYSYNWTLNGQSISETATATLTFGGPGSYVVGIEIRDAAGRTAYYSETVTVQQDPTVSIVTSATNLDVGVNESLRAQLRGGVGPYVYDWLVGSHAYNDTGLVLAFTSEGNYTVTLVVSDAFGHDATATAQISVYPDPTIGVSHSSTLPIVSEPYSLVVQVSGGYGPFAYLWTFASGQQQNGSSIAHVFETGGPRTYQVRVSDAGGYTGVFAFSITARLYVSASATTGIGPAPLSEIFLASVLGGSGYAYNWSFGDGNYSVSSSPTQTYSAGNWTVRLVVRAANGAEGFANLTIVALPPPVVVTWSPASNITVRTQVNFSATPTWVAGTNYSSTWVFPNGAQANGGHVSYIFAVYDQFQSVLYTFAYSGGNYSLELTVDMRPAAPTAVIGGLSADEPSGTLLAISGAKSSSPDANITSWQWSIDSPTASLAYSGTTIYLYANATGRWNVSLTVLDSLGAIDSTSQTFLVEAPGNSRNITIQVASQIFTDSTRYNVTVRSALSPISAVDALLGGAVLPITRVNGSANWQNYTLTLSYGSYNAGTYSLEFVAFAKNGASNSTSLSLTISPVSGVGGFDLVSFLGGPTNFLVIVLTAIGSIAAVVGLRQRETTNIDIDGTILTGKPGGELRLSKRSRTPGPTKKGEL